MALSVAATGVGAAKAAQSALASRRNAPSTRRNVLSSDALRGALRSASAVPLLIGNRLAACKTLALGVQGGDRIVRRGRAHERGPRDQPFTCRAARTISNTSPTTRRRMSRPGRWNR